VKLGQPILKRFDEEWRRTKALGVRMRHGKQRPTAVLVSPFGEN